VSSSGWSQIARSSAASSLIAVARRFRAPGAVRSSCYYTAPTDAVIRCSLRLAALGSLLAACALGSAADPPPLLKPVAGTSAAPRLRFPFAVPKNQPPDAQFKALIPKPKGKKGEYTEILLSVSPYVSGTGHSTQQWKAWGFEVPADRLGVLPELVIPGAQLGTAKGAKGRDAEFRVTNLKVQLGEAPGGEKAGISNALTVPLSVLTGGNDRAAEPRFYMSDRFLELSAPAKAVRKLDTSNVPLGEVTGTDDAKLKAATIPMTGAAFNYVSVNGFTQYLRPNGTPERVVGYLLVGTGGGDIVMTVPMARGCAAQLDKEIEPTSAVVKELRIGPITGPDLKGQRDFVLRDVRVTISNNESASVVYFGPVFVEKYFKDGINACGPDGVWRLHGRVKPEDTDDVKTRIVPKVPKKP